MNKHKTIQKFFHIFHFRHFFQAILIGLVTGIVSIGFIDVFESREVTYLLVGLLSLVVFGPIWYRIHKRSLDWIEPGIWFALFYFAHFGVRAIYNLMFGSPIIGLSLGAGDLGLLNVALGVSIIGLLVFWLGYRVHFGKIVGNSLPVLPRKWNITSALVVALLCILFGWGLRIFLALQVGGEGGVAAWLAADKFVVFAQAEGTMYLNIFANLAKVGLFIIFILARMYKYPIYWFLFAFLLVPELVFNFIGGSRAQFIFLLLGLVVILYMTSGRGYKASMRYGRWAAILIIALIVLFPIFSALRGGITTPQAVLSHATLFWADPTRLFEVVWARQHGLDSLAVVIEHVPEIEPFALSQQLFLPLIAWVPREFWPEKPTISLGKIFYEKFFPPIFHEGTAVAVTLPGQFYWALGLAGVIMGMFFIGVLWQVLFKYLVQPTNNLSNILVVSMIFPMFFVIVEQTTVALLTMHLFQFLLIVLITLTIRGKSVKKWRSLA
ncbi:oligosaccharide repeat unit polymerase [Thermodesulfovibrionales bacterium]|nr:oligosaccharide repeat unit polymerase [Thermodesulfovibrionales bacterium]